MKTVARAVVALALFLTARNSLTPGQDPPHRGAIEQGGSSSPKLTEKQEDSLLLAIQDEIYDYGFEKKYYRIGVTAGAGAGVTTKLPVYIRPYFDKDGAGEMIYKEMPYGEILRVFHFQSDVLAVLDNDPELGFPITQPSHLTLFMDDDELCEDRKTWVRRTLQVEDTPPKSRVLAGAERQQKRVGFSVYLYKHAASKRASSPSPAESARAPSFTHPVMSGRD